MKDNKKTNLCYVYNPEQMMFYKENGCKYLKVDVHRKTKKVFWVYDKDECYEAFIKWNNREH